jgi:hypothetical protein
MITMAILKLRQPSRSTESGSTTSATHSESTSSMERPDYSMINDGQPLMLSPSVRSPLVRRDIGSCDTSSSVGKKKKSYLEKTRKELPETKQRRACVNKALESALEFPSDVVRHIGILNGWTFRNVRRSSATSQDDSDTDAIHHQVFKSLDDSDDNMDALMFRCGRSTHSQPAEISRGSNSSKSNRSTIATLCTNASSDYENSSIHVFNQPQCDASLTSEEKSTFLPVQLAPTRNNNKVDGKPVQSPRNRPQRLRSDHPTNVIRQLTTKQPGHLVRSKSAEWSGPKGSYNNIESYQVKQMSSSGRKIPSRSKSAGSSLRGNNHRAMPSISRSNSVETCQLQDCYGTKSNHKQLDGMGNHPAHSSYDSSVLASCLFPQVAPTTPQTRSKPSLLTPRALDLSSWHKSDFDRSNSSRPSIAHSTRVSSRFTPGNNGCPTDMKHNDQPGDRSLPTLCLSTPTKLTPRRRKSSSNRNKSPYEYISSTIEEQRALARELAEALSVLPVAPLSESERRRSSWVAAERSRVTSSSPSPSLHRRPSIERSDSDNSSSVHRARSVQQEINTGKLLGSTGSFHSTSNYHNRRSMSTNGESTFQSRRQRSLNASPSGRTPIQRTTSSDSSLKYYRRSDTQASAEPPSRSYSACETMALTTSTGRPDQRVMDSRLSVLSRRRQRETSSSSFTGQQPSSSRDSSNDEPPLSSTTSESVRQQHKDHNQRLSKETNHQVTYTNLTVKDWDSASSASTSMHSSDGSGSIQNLQHGNAYDRTTVKTITTRQGDYSVNDDNSNNAPPFQHQRRQQQQQQQGVSLSTTSSDLQNLISKQEQLRHPQPPPQQRQQKSLSTLSTDANTTEGSSIDLSLLINHMASLDRLEQRSNERVQAMLNRKKGDQAWTGLRKQLGAHRVQIQLQLLAVIEGTIAKHEFQNLYQLTTADVESVTEYFHSCLQLQEDIRWDLIYHVVVPERTMEMMMVMTGMATI